MGGRNSIRGRRRARSALMETAMAKRCEARSREWKKFLNIKIDLLEQIGFQRTVAITRYTGGGGGIGAGWNRKRGSGRKAAIRGKQNLKKTGGGGDGRVNKGVRKGAEKTNDIADYRDQIWGEL